MKKIARSLLLLVTLFLVGDLVAPMMAQAQPRHRRYHRRVVRHRRSYRRR